jgi:beta-mannosidase
MGMGHGHYVFRDDVTGTEVFQLMPGAGKTAYSEFGVSSPADADILRSIIPPEDLWPPRAGTAWETHHAFGQWAQDAWLRQPMIERYLGPQAGLDDVVANGQLLQAVGLQFTFEEARRQKPYCSMALNWCLNEPWPTAAGNSLISYPARPKPSLAVVAAANRPVLASARVSRFVWTEGEELTADLFVLNDAAGPLPAGILSASIRPADPAQGETPLLEWPFPAAEPGRNVVGPQVRWRLPRLAGDRFTLVLRVGGRPELDSEYLLLFRRRAGVADGGVRALNQ